MAQVKQNNNDTMSKDKALLLLSTRLGCTVDSLSFLFGAAQSINNNLGQMQIPNYRDQ